MLISKYIILIFSPKYLFYPGFFFLCRRRERYSRAYTVATPLPAVQHRQYIRCMRIQIEYIYIHICAYLRLYDCVVKTKPISLRDLHRPGLEVTPPCPSCSAWGIALFNKPRRKDVNKAASDK